MSVICGLITEEKLGHDTVYSHDRTELTFSPNSSGIPGSSSHCIFCFRFLNTERSIEFIISCTQGTPILRISMEKYFKLIIFVRNEYILHCGPEFLIINISICSQVDPKNKSGIISLRCNRLRSTMRSLLSRIVNCK